MRRRRNPCCRVVEEEEEGKEVEEEEEKGLMLRRGRSGGTLSRGCIGDLRVEEMDKGVPGRDLPECTRP